MSHRGSRPGLRATRAKPWSTGAMHRRRGIGRQLAHLRESDLAPRYGVRAERLRGSPTAISASASFAVRTARAIRASGTTENSPAASRWVDSAKILTERMPSCLAWRITAGSCATVKVGMARSVSSSVTSKTRDRSAGSSGGPSRKRRTAGRLRSGLVAPWVRAGGAVTLISPSLLVGWRNGPVGRHGETCGLVPADGGLGGRAALRLPQALEVHGRLGGSPSSLATPIPAPTAPMRSNSSSSSSSCGSCSSVAKARLFSSRGRVAAPSLPRPVLLRSWGEPPVRTAGTGARARPWRGCPATRHGRAVCRVARWWATG